MLRARRPELSEATTASAIASLAIRVSKVATAYPVASGWARSGWRKRAFSGAGSCRFGEK